MFFVARCTFLELPITLLDYVNERMILVYLIEKSRSLMTGFSCLFCWDFIEVKINGIIVVFLFKAFK